MNLLEARSIVASPEFGTNRIARPATNYRRKTTTTLGHVNRTRIGPQGRERNEEMKYIDNPELVQLSRVLTHEAAECTVNTRIEAYTTKPVTKDKRLWKTLERDYEEEQAVIQTQFHSPPKGNSPTSANTPPGPTEPKMSAVAYVESVPGPVDKRDRKTLFILKATLNAAFPHHDFSSVKAEHFTKEANEAARVLRSLSNTLSSVTQRHSSGAYQAPLQPRSYGAYPPPMVHAGGLFPSSVPTSSSPVNLFAEMERRQRYGDGLSAGTHPGLFRTLDEVIGLDECEVYSYTPDPDADPHGGGGESDGEDSDEAGSDGDSGEEGSAEEVGGNWYDDRGETSSGGEDEEEPRLGRRGGRGGRGGRGVGIAIPGSEGQKTRSYMSHGYYGSLLGLKYKGRVAGSSSSPVRRRTGAALLWSNHWFFLNRKQKRVLFISIWAKSKVHGYSPDRFLGWTGAAGAGLTAFRASTASTA